MCSVRQWSQSSFKSPSSWFCVKDFCIHRGFVSTNKILYVSKKVLHGCNSHQNVSFRAEVSNDYKCVSAQAMVQDHVSLKRTYHKFVGELLGVPSTLIGAFEALRCDRVYAKLQRVKEEKKSWNAWISCQPNMFSVIHGPPKERLIFCHCSQRKTSYLSLFGTTLFVLFSHGRTHFTTKLPFIIIWIQ